jgi:hypothetical protein
MAEPHELILDHLRAIRGVVEATREDVRDLKVRMTSVEEGLAGVNRRLDRIDARLDRAEVRLELTEVEKTQTSPI